MKQPAGALLPNLEGPFPAGSPLHLQIYLRIRGAVLGGMLPPGSRLPSTRTLAADLGISRNTAEEAFSQLEAEGYLVRRVGAGSYVALPDSPARPARQAPPPSRGARSLSIRGRTIAAAGVCAEPTVPRPFAAGLPALEAFPLETWSRLVARRLRRSGRGLLGYGDPAGYGPLREAVAAYLGTARGVTCSPRQVIVLTSSQQALDLAARLLVDPGDEAWLEEPGYLGARSALTAAGARIVPVPVDENGLDVARGEALSPGARLAYVTPSHQYPLGVTLSLERRLALLAWAGRAGSWIVEDDYDSELRYTGRPLAAIQGLDSGGRVLYVGTFTKALFPGLRLAYLVAPEDLVDAFVHARTLMDGHTPTLLQAVLADFLAEGHFGAHVRRMRALYHERRDALVEAAEGRAVLGPVEAGFHATLHLPEGTDDQEVARRAAQRGVEVQPLSTFYLGKAVTPGLVLGFAGISPEAIREGMKILGEVL
ncbi:MAG TPA: PLP-dependent aminotransferase family protein [Thermoanaerobaculia bacterium]|nr:PLP-dependent aminotransferase family protein [Thermoanaerobaculia bacterium]